MVRHADDFYATPDWCADLGAGIALRPDSLVVLDPCAGDGSLMRAVQRCRPGLVRTLGLELDSGRAELSGAQCCDALDPNITWPDADAILMNPPFRRWQEFVDRALAHRARVVVVLLRLGSLASQGRRAWWQQVGEQRGVEVHVLSRRPSFTGGKTDATDYAWIALLRNRARNGVYWL